MIALNRSLGWLFRNIHWRRKLTDLIILTLMLLAFYSLHRAIEAFRARRAPQERTILELLEYDPELHELTVTLQDGQTITGTPDSSTRNPTQDGLLLRDTRGDSLHGTVTYIQAGQITAVEITNRENIDGFLTKGDVPRPPN